MIFLYAAVDVPNGRIWGISDSEQGALFDAAAQLQKLVGADPSATLPPDGELTVHTVSIDEGKRIADGETRWPLRFA